MDDYKSLRENILFRDLSEQEFNKLISISKKIIVEEGEYFIHEGDVEENFYFILEGEVAITKSGIHYQNEHIIAYLKKGDTVGEISLLDQKPRSASGKAIKRAELLSFSFPQLKQLARETPSFDKILWGIAVNLITRIRKTSVDFVEALESKLEEYRLRVLMDRFIINIVISLCLFAFFLSWITQQENRAIASTIISLPLTSGFVLLFFSIMKSSKLPLKTFGLTTQGWRKAVYESVFFTIILCMVIVFIKWALIQATSLYAKNHVFEPYLTIHLSKKFHEMSYHDAWWIIFFIYSFIITPLQELIVRGGLQGPLEIFMSGKNAVLKAIFISNLIFATSHLFMGISTAILALLAGLYLGWLYSRHHTLIGVILAHALVGIWATMVVGF